MTIEKLLDECNDLYWYNEFERLNELCDEILEMDPDNQIAMGYKSVAYCFSNHPQKALELLKHAIELYPDNYYFKNNSAMVYYDLGEYEKSLRCCNEGLKIKDFDWLLENKIKALIMLERIDEAYELYNASKIWDFSFKKTLIRCGKYSSICRYDEEISNDELVVCLLKRCESLNRKSDYEEILEVCDEIFKMDADNEIALGYRIHSLAFLERSDEVIRCSDHAIKLYPDNFRFYFEKAEMLLWIFEDIDGAVENYEKGFALLDDFESYWYDIDNLVYALEKKADILIESGKFDEAVEVYDRMLFYKRDQFDALDNIDELTEKHGVRYDYSKHYNESLKLKIQMENKYKRIAGYLETIDIGEYDMQYVKGCSRFKDYESIDEYVRDIIICLIEAYHEYDEKSAKEMLKYAMENVKRSFEVKEPAYDFAVVYGYACG